jgi:hypothetical protein
MKTFMAVIWIKTADDAANACDVAWAIDEAVAASFDLGGPPVKTEVKVGKIDLVDMSTSHLDAIPPESIDSVRERAEFQRRVHPCTRDGVLMFAEGGE